jgi:hypothetical protein
MKMQKGKTGLQMVVDTAARRIKQEPKRVAQDIIYEVSKHYGVDINELAAELGKRKKRAKVKVGCSVEYTAREDEYGKERDCVVVTCSKCQHETISWGHGEGSVKRCLALMREECEQGEENFYVEE